MRKYILKAWDILGEVYAGKYCDEALSAHGGDDMTTRIVYGVLENDLKIEHILGQFISSKPQKSVFILLKIGVYSLIWLNNVPNYAVVSECVEALRARGKGGACGFVNAVLKKVSSGSYTLPNKGSISRLSIDSNLPIWFLEEVAGSYGEEVANEVAGARKDIREHIRANSRLGDIKDVAQKLKAEGEDVEFTREGGLAAYLTDAVKRLFAAGIVTVQSPSSMLAVQAMGLYDGASVLDLCAAPGGKSVYISELIGSGRVTACERYPFRVKQLEGYISRMKADNITALCSDATVHNADFEGKYDFVLVDAPCSCTGTFLKHPDVFLNRQNADIDQIISTQVRILRNALTYLKRGGTLIYSTCSLLKRENDGVVEAAIGDDIEVLPISLDAAIDVLPTTSDTDIEALPTTLDACAKTLKCRYGVQILPSGLYDGFYISKLRRK